MANTFTLIASSTVGSGGAASIDFTSIPSTYTDLCIKLSLRKTGGSTGSLAIALNGSSSSFTERDLGGDGSSTFSSTSAVNYIGVANGGTTTANTFDNTEIYIPNYLSSNYKSLSSDSVSENNATGGIYTLFTSLLWSSSSAINAITFTPTNNSFAQYSTAYLYGVKNV